MRGWANGNGFNWLLVDLDHFREGKKIGGEYSKTFRQILFLLMISFGAFIVFHRLKISSLGLRTYCNIIVDVCGISKTLTKSGRQHLGDYYSQF